MVHNRISGRSAVLQDHLRKEIKMSNPRYEDLIPSDGETTEAWLDGLIEGIFPRALRRGHLLRWQSQGAKKLRNAILEKIKEDNDRPSLPTTRI